MITTTIRISKELHERLRREAFEKKISLNQVITQRLERKEKKDENPKHS